MTGIPDLGAIAAYEPRWPGVREHNLGNEWRARYIDDPEIPADAPVAYVYALLYAENKGYVVRPAGTEVWGTVEGPAQQGEPLDAVVKRLCKEQAAATVKRVVPTGFMECRATSHNPNFPVGTTVVRPFVLAIASKVGEMPGDAPYQRRRLPTNEHMTAIRKRYPELDTYFGSASNRYFIMAAKGEV